MCHIRVCVCLAVQFVFFSRADSGVLLTVIIAQVSDSTISIYHTQSSRTLFESVLISSRSRRLLQQVPAPMENATQPPRHRSLLVLSRGSCVIGHKLGHITEWLLLLLVELDIPTPPELNGPVILHVAPLQRTPSECRLQSS